ncbi:Krueppel homolog 1-like [Malaya genurostris]|uniref:Krueppel homolog 1-like n=1 Tax=Malaya genurostris TaxID=325434 RepID=UPI0026F3D5F5|nr:Krueppel homolog 1-like [Malaya genurostris]
MDTPKRIKTISSLVSSPALHNQVLLGADSTPSGYNHHHHWNPVGGWPPEALTSPASTCSSPETLFGKTLTGTPTTTTNCGSSNNDWKHQLGTSSAEKSENKRGRPRSEALTTLMVEGSVSPSAIKCRYCNRVFPREKSLQAHLRTHTGERPYQCDYPGCTRAFTQSGQLKTHQRLHTGERPFICSAANCQMRFTHANRHCPDHPYDTLKRCDDFVIQTVPEQNSEVLKWLDKYRMEREDRTPTRKTPKRANHSAQNENENRSRTASNNENYAINGTTFQSPITPRSPFKSRKGLMCELDMNAGMGLAASPITAKTKPNIPKLIQWQEPTSQEEDESGDESSGIPIRSTFNPKKKWLRDAWQEDLAKPLEPSIISPQVLSSTTSTAALKQQLNQERNNLNNNTTLDPNQMRPTVLMVASKDSARPLNEQTVPSTQTGKPEESNRKLQGALALMQLATEESAALMAPYMADTPIKEVIDNIDGNTNTSCSPPLTTTFAEHRPLRIPMISHLSGDIDHSIPFTLAAEAYANYQRL